MDIYYLQGYLYVWLLSCINKGYYGYYFSNFKWSLTWQNNMMELNSFSIC